MSEQENAATPAAQPAAPAAEEKKETANPSEQAATPAQTQQGEETVTLSKAEAEQLRKDAARAGEAQSRADRFERAYNRATGGRSKSPFAGGDTKTNEGAVAPTEEDRMATATAEDRKAEQGLMGLALDPKFRPVFDSDRTLRELLSSNPLGVLPLLAPNAIDAADAMEMVVDALESRLEELGKSKAGQSEETTPAAPATPTVKPVAATTTPPPGGVNAPAATTPNSAYEEAQKDTNTERGVAGMIKARLQNGGS